LCDSRKPLLDPPCGRENSCTFSMSSYRASRRNGSVSDCDCASPMRTCDATKPNTPNTILELPTSKRSDMRHRRMREHQDSKHTFDDVWLLVLCQRNFRSQPQPTTLTSTRQLQYKQHQNELFMLGYTLSNQASRRYQRDRLLPNNSHAQSTPHVKVSCRHEHEKREP